MPLSPGLVFLLSFAAGAIGGLTYVTKGDGVITRRKLLHTVLRQGCGGLVISLAAYKWAKDSDVMQCMVIAFGMMIGMLGELGIHHLGRIMFLGARKFYGLDAHDDTLMDIDREHSDDPSRRGGSGNRDYGYRRNTGYRDRGRRSSIDESIWDDDGGAINDDDDDIGGMGIIE